MAFERWAGTRDGIRVVAAEALKRFDQRVGHVTTVNVDYRTMEVVVGVHRIDRPAITICAPYDGKCVENVHERLLEELRNELQLVPKGPADAP